MKRLITCLAAALLMPAITPSARAADTPDGPGLPPLQTFGGTVSDPVVAAPYVYVPSGRVVTAWDYASTHAAPAGPASSPVPGIINGLVRLGGYLYASWRGSDGTGGVAAFSLDDPAHPALVSVVDDYVDAEHRFPVGIAAAAGHLYLFDSDHGVFVGSLSDPGHPQFRWSGLTGGVQYKHTVAYGHTLYAMGRTLLGGSVYHAYDVSHPDDPVLAGSFSGGGTAFFNIRSAPPLAAGVGTQVSVLDISNPRDIRLRGSLPSPPATDALMRSHYLYSVGFDGLDVWDIADPDQPVAHGHVDIPALGTSGVATWADDGLLLTADDRLQRLDLSRPDRPRLSDTAWLPGGVAARDAALVGDHLVTLQANYGLGIADADSLQPQARFDANLPPQLNKRDFEGFTVKAHHAYLAAWAYGLIIADISDPLHPVETGRLPFGYADNVVVQGSLAYLTKTTEGPELAVVDVADPTQPALRGRFGLPGRVDNLQIDGHHAYLADYSVAGTHAPSGGLRILDIADPDQPRQTSLYSDHCERAYDVAVDHRTQRAYVACTEGLQIVDVTDADAPRTLGRFAVENASQATVALRGDRVWFGSSHGVYEIDISDPTTPALVRTTPTHGTAPEHIRAVDDGRVFVMGNTAGMQVLGTREHPVPLTNGTPVAAEAGEAEDSQLFVLEVPDGARALGLRSFGGQGDITLYAAQGHMPTAADHDYVSARPGNSEMVTVPKPAAGPWYIRITGTTRFSGVQVLGTFQP